MSEQLNKVIDKYLKGDCSTYLDLPEEERDAKVLKIAIWVDKLLKEACTTCNGRGIVQVEYDNGKIKSESCNDCNGKGNDNG